MRFWWQNYWTLQFQLLGSTAAILIQDWAKLANFTYSLAKAQLCRAQKKWVQGTRFKAGVNHTSLTLVCGVAHHGASPAPWKGLGSVHVFLFYFQNKWVECSILIFKLVTRDPTCFSRMTQNVPRCLYHLPGHSIWFPLQKSLLNLHCEGETKLS